MRSTGLAARPASSNLAAKLSIRVAIFLQTSELLSAGYFGPRILANGFQLDLDLDLIADQEAASFESHIPVQTKILPVEVRLRAKPGNGLAQWIGADAVEGDVEGDLARLSADREITGYAEVLARTGYAPTLKSDRGMVGDVEEVGRAEVLVSLGIAGDQRRHVNFGL